MKIWVNPVCSKCIAATEALDEAGIDYGVRRYLDEPPTAGELRDVLDRLGLEPWDIARTEEPEAAKAGLSSFERTPSWRDRWVAAMVASPILIQRPIITAEDGTTVVGRDEEALARVIRAEGSAEQH